MNSVFMVLALSGCALEPGTGFATLAGLDLLGEYELGAARDLGDNTLLTDLGFHVRLDALELDVARVSFEELLGGTVDFDPANPPDGYSLCHGGHCHAADGRLVDYADIEAELAGDSASFEPVATLSTDGTFDLLAGDRRRLESVEPSAELPATVIRRCSVDVEAVRMSGSVTAGGLAEELLLVVDLDLDGALTTGFDLEIDRDTPAVLDLTVEVVVDGTVFDGIDLAGLAADGTVHVTESTAEGASLFVDAFQAIAPSVVAENVP